MYTSSKLASWRGNFSDANNCLARQTDANTTCTCQGLKFFVKTNARGKTVYISARGKTVYISAYMWLVDISKRPQNCSGHSTNHQTVPHQAGPLPTRLKPLVPRQIVPHQLVPHQVIPLSSRPTPARPTPTRST